MSTNKKANKVKELLRLGVSTKEICEATGLKKGVISYHRNRLGVEIGKYGNRYDWEDIQRVYDAEQLTYDELHARFGVTKTPISLAISRGDFTPRVTEATFSERTLFEVDQSHRVGGTNRQAIRRHARTVLNRAGVPKVCSSCDWKEHVEACHIRPIVSFPPSTPISEINALDNLTYLCPNCHWVHDHKSE